MMPHRHYFSSSPYNIITSTKSQTVKKIQGLLTKRKKRVESGQTVVEGPRMVLDLLENPKTSHLVRQILINLPDYDRREDYYRSKIIENIETMNREDILIQLVDPDVFPSCTDTMTPQGIVAVVDIPTFSDDDDDVNVNKDSTTKPPLYLVLDGVSDPGNVGTLLRSSLAVGVVGVILLPGCCDVWNPKCLRSAMGASFQLPIVQTDSWQECLQFLQAKNVRHIYAATMIDEDDNDNDDTDDDNPRGATSIPYFDVNFTEQASSLIIGSEGNGLSTEIRQQLLTSLPSTTKKESDDIIMATSETTTTTLRATHIPMETGIESLNAAVCGSVILFEYSRQCLQKVK
jgi:TrmH family RNA methyltransferase